jgi:hypothetical protein
MDSTSHQYFVTTRGAPAAVEAITVTITGEVPSDAGLGLTGPWRWSTRSDAGTPRHPGLAPLRGQEDRFFMGPDATIFDAPPGTRVETVIRGGRLVIVGVDLARELPASLDGACVVVVAHRGRMAFDEAVRRAQALLARGAHAVVGRGFGPVSALEFIDGGVWAPSLGPLLGRDGPGAVLGLTCAQSTRARLMPVVVTKGVPRLDRVQLDARRGEKPSER